MSKTLRTYSLAAALVAFPTLAAAQHPASAGSSWYDGHVTVMAGASVYDHIVSGTTGIYALRADMPVYPNVLVEGGLSYARTGDAAGVDEVFIPGVQVQLQGTSGQFSPYVGLGAGVTVERFADERATDLSFAPSFAAGVRIAVSQGAGIRVEGRLNAVGADFRGVYSEIAAG